MPQRIHRIHESRSKRFPPGGLNLLERTNLKYRLEYKCKGLLSHRFQAASDEEALKIAADRLGIIHPMALSMFIHMGATGLFAEGRSNPIFPPPGASSHH
jgi:hypothetical protein